MVHGEWRVFQLGMKNLREKVSLANTVLFSYALKVAISHSRNLVIYSAQEEFRGRSPCYG